MRVLFDAFWWVRGPLANRTVLRELVLEWARSFPEDELILAVPRRDPMDASAPGLRVVRTRFRPHALSNAVEIAFLQRSLNADVAVVHNYTPVFGRSVTFIHDLLFEEHPTWFSVAERVYFWPMSRLAVRASLVATSSRTEAARIERLHPRLAPVRAVGLAVATALRESRPTRPEGTEGLSAFALSVGRLNTRKNLANAITGAVRSGLVTAASPLLVAGSAEHSGVGGDLPVLIRSFVDEGVVRFLGRVSDGELRWLYEHATVTLYCSLDEGFGLPPVEASAFGSPVVVSDLPVFRETMHGNAHFADPLDPEAIASAVRRAWGSRDGRESAASAAFSWRSTVAALRDATLSSASRR